MVATGRVVPAAGALLFSAVFIILSADLAVGRQCYWCGPLAEQVHRSRRAPSCEGGGRHITVCEPGYYHCAVVATSPPYLESRFCVKMYQDECYPLFCNSTKTWKMTCPCRGDLCNGANDVREEDAFAVLGKLVAKTHSRVKKRTPTLQLTVNRKGRLMNPEQNDEPLLSDNSINEVGSSSQTQNETFTIETSRKHATESNPESSPMNNNTSSTNEPVAIETAESENDSSSKSNASNETAENGVNENTDETSANIKPASTKLDSENVNLLAAMSTIMIEIDIVHRPSNFDPSTQGTSVTTMYELDFQADEPEHHNDQVDVDMTKHKTPETNSSPPKLQTVEIVTTSQTSPADPSDELYDNMEANHLKPESTDPIHKESSPPESSPEQSIEMAQTHAEVQATSTMTPTTGNTVTVKTTTTNKKSTKDKNNTALRLSVNTIIIIIQSILIRTII